MTNFKLGQRDSCSFCNTKLQLPVIDLGEMPNANSYITKPDIKTEKLYPLAVCLCENCKLCQLNYFLNPEELFANYSYLSSCSKSWLVHTKDYCQRMITRFELNANSKVIEAASNDGYLLKNFVEQGIPVLGIEPASNVAKIARNNGINTFDMFLNTNNTAKIVNDFGKADLIIANNVLAHVPDIKDFTKAMQLLLADNGVITIEVPHLLNFIKNCEFDTIYHEHFYYFSLHALVNIFDEINLKIFDVDELPSHGGSIRVYITHKDNDDLIVNDIVNELLQDEIAADVITTDGFKAMQAEVDTIKNDFLKLITELKLADKTVIAYGAPAKGNTFLNYCKVDVTQITATADKSEFKQNKLLPGTHIPVLQLDNYYKLNPDYVVILPWNIKSEVMEQLKSKFAGTKFITTIPKVEVIE